jgi:hypothetical protein
MSRGGNIFPGWMFSGADETATLSDLLPSPAPPPLPASLTPKGLREAIARVLARISANELAEECVRFGLPAQEDREDGPLQGKYRHVARVYDDDGVLNHLLGLDCPGGVRGEMKNLIFAADGPKPRIVLAMPSTTISKSPRTPSTAWSTTGR